MDRDGVDPAAVEHERKVLKEQAESEGKPPEIAEKMVEGRLGKFFKEVALLDNDCLSRVNVSRCDCHRIL